MATAVAKANDDFSPNATKRIDSYSGSAGKQDHVDFATTGPGSTSQVVEAAAMSPAKPEPAKPAVEETLKLVNANFCTSVSGYGQFDNFEQNRFGPNQHLLVYCEIENFKSSKEQDDSYVNFVTRLQGSYTILDAAGRQVDAYKFPVVEDVARNQRRDFYVHLPVQLSELAIGEYTLQVVIEDLHAQTSATLAKPLQFEVID